MDSPIMISRREVNCRDAAR